MDCEKHSDCLTNRAYCHPKTKMCLCKNGVSTYPTCSSEVSDTCQPECAANQFCNSVDQKCMCKLGGFPPHCNTKKCGAFKAEINDECTCMYGTERDGSCKKCRQNCGKFAKCEKQGILCSLITGK